MPATWGMFAESAPHLAGTGLRLIEHFGMVFLATLRRSGAPRLHPVVPIIGLGGLHVFIGPESPKRLDLLRDPRYALHAPLGQDDEEFMLTGESSVVSDPRVLAYVTAAAPFVPSPGATLFSFGIDVCLWTIWENVGQPDTRPIREVWRPDTATGRLP
jgi:hypothetical protein